MNKFLSSFTFHCTVVGLLIGLAVGATSEHLNLVICYGLNGTAATCGIAFVVRCIRWVDRNAF